MILSYISLVMLSTFSCAYSPSVCHLWKNVDPGPLSIFKSVFFFFFNNELYEFFIYCGHQLLIGEIFCKYLLPFSRLPFRPVGGFLHCEKSF